jgi:hypothetical protein
MAALASPKKIGGYLVDAGLLSVDQINVALNDQQATGMRFGEIIVARGWLKEQTVEWVMTKVVEPERQRQQRHSAESPAAANPWSNQQRTKPSDSIAASSANTNNTNSGYGNAAKAAEMPTQKPFVRREVPISKPLPSVGSSDGDVNWVG